MATSALITNWALEDSMLRSILALTENTVLIGPLWSSLVKFAGATHSDSGDIHDCTFLHMSWQRSESFTGGLQVKGHLTHSEGNAQVQFYRHTGCEN